jgi:hypothetical protein
MDELIAHELFDQRVGTTLIAVFAILAVLLAAIGIYRSNRGVGGVWLDIVDICAWLPLITRSEALVPVKEAV